MSFKVKFLAIAAVFAVAINANAEVSVATDSINGDDASVTFVRLNNDTYRAVLTNSSKPFDINVKAWEWARSIMTFQSSAVNANDSVEVTVQAGGNAYKFWSRDMGWTRVLPGQKVSVTEIYSDQGGSVKKYLAYTALKDEQVANYAAYAPKAKPTVNRRSNAASAPQNKSTADNNKKAKGKKKGKRLTEEEVMEDVLANTGDYYIEEEGNPRVK
jgi:hypothetical protein